MNGLTLLTTINEYTLHKTEDGRYIIGKNEYDIVYPKDLNDALETLAKYTSIQAVNDALKQATNW